AAHQWHNVSVAYSYYAVFTAMWVAVGDPPKKKWSHRGLFQNFAPGGWRTPSVPLARSITTAIRNLYDARLQADYRAVHLTVAESSASLRTAYDVLVLVAAECGLSLGGISP